MLRIVIIDDETNTWKVTTTILRTKLNNVQVVGMAENVKSGIEMIHLQKPDIVLLDIQMPDGTGFDLLKQIKEIDFKVIFITAFHEYAVKAFKFSALDYLLKPINSKELINAIKRVEETIQMKNINPNLNAFNENMSSKSKESKKIILKTSDNIYLVPVKEIIRCEADVNYTRFFLEDGRKLFVSKTLKEYEELLGEFGFMRVHQSHLINTDFMERYQKAEGGSVVMKDETIIPVALRKRDALLKLLEDM
jgi:two-component system LytT family response regulator